AFNIIAVDAEGKLQDRAGLSWSLVRLERVWQWFKRDGRWSYDAATVPRTVASGAIDATASGPVKISAPVTWGRYRLVVETPASDATAAMRSSLVFRAGWSGADDTESPEVLDVALDKESYADGETARINVSTKRGGHAVVTVLANSVLYRKSVVLADGDSEITLPVSADWGAGAYATVMLHRPMNARAKRMPTRAVGLAWIGIDPASRSVGVTIGGPEKMRSGRTVTLPVSVSGIDAGDTAYLTLAAVDVGILNLTRFESPDPAQHFSAQTRLGAEIRDIYGRLIDGMRAERGSLRSGGDADPNVGMMGRPPASETVALFSGLVRVGPDGKANVTFDLPAFNGTVRLMAVAWTDRRTGKATRDMTVRDPVAVTTSLPRFLTLGDQAQMTVDLHNVEGADGDYQLAVQSAGDNLPVRSVGTETVTLKNGERRALTMKLAPRAVGPTTLTFTVTGPNELSIVRERTLRVHPPGGDVKLTTVRELAPGTTVKLDAKWLNGLIARDSRLAVNVGPLAAFDVPGLLAGLDRYPYGCTEQTVSRALPLLSANALSSEAGLATDDALKDRIQTAIQRVLATQDSSGAFGVWGPHTTDLWLTGYVTDFLTRAREAGYVVDAARFRQALDRLANSVAYTQDVTNGGAALAYALYVLARNGRAPVGELRYYADAKLAAFKQPLAKAQIGTALAMVGDRERANRVFAAAIAAVDLSAAPNSRADFGSNLRDAAAILALGTEARISRFDRSGLAQNVAAAYARRQYTSTQEKAWLLLAAKAISDTGADVRLKVGDNSHAGALRRTFVGPDLIAKPRGLTNTGAAATSAVVTAIGPGKVALPPANAGLRITRTYYTLDGRPVDLASARGGSATVSQNDRFVVVIAISAENRTGRLLVEDRLPAGFEIENPRLVDSGNVEALSWLKTTVQPQHTEFRDDRFVAAFNLFSHRKQLEAGNLFRIGYIVRAVSVGAYVHPAATVEDMYRPERHGRTATGRLTVTPRS
ncbi:MAG: alpha-2-macroglobulin family protein, partial [Pseudomonadota bacterium]